jgi:SAM-dependent methyltransferase
MSELIWHEVECGGYSADLPLWEELARENPGPVLELGCGTGRVVIHLAKATGELVVGLEREEELIEAVWRRTQGQRHSGDAELGDARGFELHAEFQLALGPMQLIQLLDERADRVCCLSCVFDHLLPGGRAAFALVEEVPRPVTGAALPVPDVRQVDGWVYSSLPLEPEVGDDSVVLRRLRQTVSPDGELGEELNEVVLQLFSAETLEREAREVGFAPAGRREIPVTEAHLGSTVVLLEKLA